MKITIVGTGYVGLITGVGLAKLGHSVTCFDIDNEKIERIKQGDLPIYEVRLHELINYAYENNALTFTSNKEEAFDDVEFIFIYSWNTTFIRWDGRLNVYSECL